MYLQEMQNRNAKKGILKQKKIFNTYKFLDPLNKIKLNL